MSKFTRLLTMSSVLVLASCATPQADPAISQQERQLAVENHVISAVTEYPA